MEIRDIEEKQKKKGSYDFLCLECDFGVVTVEAADLNEATNEGFRQHDEHHKTSGANCGAHHYQMTLPNGTLLEF